MKPAYTYSMRIPFADTDLAGIVHFANFFRYMENAEHAFFRSLGYSIHPSGSGATGLAVHEGYGWPRVSATCDYKKPLRFEQEVQVEVHVLKRGAKTIDYEFHFLTEQHEGPVAVGKMTVICVRFDEEAKRMRAVDMPEVIGSKIDSASQVD